MAPSPATRRSLLGLALCLCLLPGHTHGAEEEEEPQLQREDLNEGMERRTLPPYLMPNRKEESDSLPTVKKNGDLYFDVAEAKETQLEIPLSGSRVRGVTATSRRCPVQSLVLGKEMGKGYLLDEDLFTHCPLKNLTLKGRCWRCLEEGRLLQRPGLVVDVEYASCCDAWYYNSTNDIPVVYSMQEGIQKFQKFGITGCSTDNCDCNWYFNSSAYNISMDCEGRGLTDDALAKMLHLLPTHVTKIDLSENNLSSVDILIENFRPHHEELEVLTLDYNQMTTLPRLGRFFPRIIHISLRNNLIEKIDLEEFKDLVSRKDLVLNVKDNPLRCDLNMYYLKSYIHDRCMAGWKDCRHYFKTLKCRNEPNGKPVPLYKVSNPGIIWDMDWWLFLNITLGILNAIMITLIVDMILVLANVRGNQGRRPLMDHLVCWLKPVPLLPGSRDQGGNGQRRRRRLKQ